MFILFPVYWRMLRTAGTEINSKMSCKIDYLLHTDVYNVEEVEVSL
jgi:hypothetical protein